MEGSEKMKLDTNKLQMVMAEKCVEIRELSKKTGVAECTISKIKHKKQNAKPVTIGKLAKGLGVQITELLETEN